MLHCHKHRIASAPTPDKRRAAQDGAFKMLQPIEAFLLVLAQEPELDVTGDAETMGARWAAVVAVQGEGVGREGAV